MLHAVQQPATEVASVVHAVESAKWFYAYLNNFEPKKLFVLVSRHEVIAWTDVADPSRTIAAVIYAGGRWLCTMIVVPDHIWRRFIPRAVNQIGMQELIVVSIMLQTFVCTLKGCALTCLNDNDGALGSLLKGSSSLIDMSNVVGYTWLMIDKMSVLMLSGCVESGVNIEGGPPETS